MRLTRGVIVWLGRVLGWFMVIVPAWFPVVCLVDCSIVPVVGRGALFPRCSLLAVALPG